MKSCGLNDLENIYMYFFKNRHSNGEKTRTRLYFLDHTLRKVTEKFLLEHGSGKYLYFFFKIEREKNDGESIERNGGIFIERMKDD